MGRLIYTYITSADGYVEDAHGKFDWGVPDEEIHRFANELERPIGLELLGRRMYEVMLYWETFPLDESEPEYARDFARIWQAKEKVVYSRTLTSVSSARTRLESNFDPQAIRRLKETSDRDIAIGGADLAGQAIRAGLVDEVQLVVVPVAVGGGKPWFPTGVRAALTLVQVHRFSRGDLFLRYTVTGTKPEPGPGT